jgi:hypothetical protein
MCTLSTADCTPCVVAQRTHGIHHSLPSSPVDPTTDPLMGSVPIHGNEEQCPEQSDLRGDENPLSSNHQRGDLLAVKLTGDSFVPRWQFSFIVSDLSNSGLLRIADEVEFRGARVVRSLLHHAAEDFEYGEWSISEAMTEH